jgi:hypothetical protein
MCKYFDATDEFGVETTQDMDPFHKLAPGAGMKSGIMKAHITVYEPGDNAHPSLPTLREFLDKNVDPTTGILTFSAPGNVRLSMDPAPLRALPSEHLDYRVGPGCSFVTHEALAMAKAERA